MGRAGGPAGPAPHPARSAADADRLRLRDRGPSQSDVWGMQSFKRKIEAASVPGGRLLCLALPS